MRFIDNIKDEELRGLVKYSFYLVVFCLLYVGLISKNNLVRWARTAIQVHAQERQMEALSEENAAMESRITDLSEKKDSIERFARENFHFAKSGDNVYLIDE